VNVAPETVAGHVKTLLELDPRGLIVAKHDRAHQTFFLNRLKAEFSRDPEGRTPNPSFAAECNRILAGFSG
jgi:adenylate cyclase